MKDMLRRLETLRNDAAECAVIAGRAETREKRELFLSSLDTLACLPIRLNKLSQRRPLPTPSLIVRITNHSRHTKNDEDFGVTS